MSDRVDDMIADPAAYGDTAAECIFTEHDVAIRDVAAIPCRTLDGQLAKLEMIRANFGDLEDRVDDEDQDPDNALGFAINFGQEAVDVAIAIAEAAARGEFAELRDVPSLMV